MMKTPQYADIVQFILLFNQNQREMQSEKQGAKTREQMAIEYNINRRTLYRWLKAVGITLSGRLITPAEQELIYQKFGNPRKIPKQVA